MSFQVSNLLWILGSVIVIILQYVYVLILGRVVKGLSIGFISCLVPMYISELFPVDAKGSSISLYHTWVTIGTTLMYLIGYLFETHVHEFFAFKWTWTIAILPSFFLILLTILLPESPKWLASKSKWVEAARTLERIRTIKKKGLNEKGLVTRAYTTGNKIKYCKYSNLFTDYRHSMVAGLTLHFLIQMTCVNVIIHFYQYICYMCGIEGDMTVVFVTTQYVLLGILTIVPVLLLDDARRIDFMSYGSLVISLTFIALFLVLVIFLVPVVNTNSPLERVLHNESASALLALILFLISTYSSSITSVSWLYTSELFPDEARAKGTSICMCMSWITNAITTLIYPICIEFGGCYVFLVLGCLIFIGTYFLLQLPETKIIQDDQESEILEIDNLQDKAEHVSLKETNDKHFSEEIVVKNEDSVKQFATHLQDTNIPNVDLVKPPLSNEKDDLARPLKNNIHINVNPFQKSNNPSPESLSSHSPISLLKPPARLSINNEFSSSGSLSVKTSHPDTVSDVIESYSADRRSPDSFYSNWNQRIISKRQIGANKVFPGRLSIDSDIPEEYEGSDEETQKLQVSKSESDHADSEQQYNDDDDDRDDYDDDEEEDSDANSSDEEIDIPGWNPIVGDKPIQPGGFLKFDTLRVSSRNQFQKNGLSVAKKNPLRS